LCDADTGTCDVEQVGRFDPPNRSEWNALGIESLSNSTQHQQISYEAALQVCLDLAPTAVRGEMMGSPKCRIGGKSQSVLIMINPIIFTRTLRISPLVQSLVLLRNDGAALPLKAGSKVAVVGPQSTARGGLLSVSGAFPSLTAVHFDRDLPMSRHACSCHRNSRAGLRGRAVVLRPQQQAPVESAGILHPHDRRGHRRRQRRRLNSRGRGGENVRLHDGAQAVFACGGAPTSACSIIAGRCDWDLPMWRLCLCVSSRKLRCNGPAQGRGAPSPQCKQSVSEWNASTAAAGIAQALQIAKDADAVVLVLGIDKSVEREGTDRTDTALPQLQVYLELWSDCDLPTLCGTDTGT
jgi:hypothetical protein